MQVSSIRPPERNNILADGSEKHAQASESAAPFCWTYCCTWRPQFAARSFAPARVVPEDVHTLPAQSPQRVVSKIAEWFWKNWNGLQVLAGQNALGVPQRSGMGAFAVISVGMLFREKNQTWTPPVIPQHCQRPFSIHACDSQRTRKEKTY
jgi:hypothetical protein